MLVTKGLYNRRLGGHTYHRVDIDHNLIISVGHGQIIKFRYDKDGNITNSKPIAYVARIMN